MTPGPPSSASAETRVPWHWSTRDEHQVIYVILGGAVVLGLALRVLPRGFDVMHTFEHRLGFMAPTCGLTRAGLALGRGDLAAAWAYNPAILLVAVLALAFVARSAVRMFSGRWLTVDVRLGATGRLVAAALVLALWLNQQAHFDRLAS